MRDTAENGPSTLDPERVRRAVDAIRQENPAYGERRGSLSMDCLGFVKSVDAVLGRQRTIPRFSSRPEELELIDIRPFADCAVGDVLFFRQKDLPEDAKRRQRVFTHVGVKYGETEVAHLSQKEGLAVEPLERVLEERVIVSRENIENVIWDEGQQAFIMRTE